MLPAALQQFRRPRHRNDQQRAAYRTDHVGHVGQLVVVPLGCNELDDGLLDLLQARSRFANDPCLRVAQLHIAVFAEHSATRLDHLLEVGVHLQKACRDVHELRIVASLLGEGL